MAGRWDRRSFVATALGAADAAVRRASALAAPASLAAPAALAAPAGEAPPPKAGKTMDIHVHLFGLGEGGTGCRLSQVSQDGLAFKYLSNKLGLRTRAKTLDEAYVLVLAEAIESSGLDKALVLAQDAVYDNQGKPLWEKTHFYVPNDYVLAVAARYPKRMVPCVAINPRRADAIEELDRCVAKGARVLKIHPPTQGVDLAEKRYAKFFRRCAELKTIVMVHTGHEHSAPIESALLASPLKLAQALEEGCTVIACHCGTGWPTDRPDMLPDFLAMIRKYENLWGDTSVLGSAGRVRDMGRLLADDAAKPRLLHGSDFPFPAEPIAFAKTLGLARAASLRAIANPIRQDFALKDALGIGQASAERAYRLICPDAGA